MRAIAISKKFPGFDIPTLTESGYKEDILGLWVGFFVPTGTPEGTIARLISAIKKVADDDGLAGKLFKNGMLMEYLPPAAAKEELRLETKTVEGIVKKMAKPK